MLTKSGHAKVMDFGIACFLPSGRSDSASEKLTVTRDLTEAGVVLGTLTYIAPEQLRGLALDARSDLYSLGSRALRDGAARNGFPSYPVYERDPFLESIRDGSGFSRLLDELRDECRGYTELYRELAAARLRL